MGCMAASEVCWPCRQQEALGALPGLESEGLGVKGEGEGARSKASTALWVKAVTSTGLCQPGLHPLLALRLDDLSDLSVPRALLR